MQGRRWTPITALAAAALLAGCAADGADQGEDAGATPVMPSASGTADAEAPAGSDGATGDVTTATLVDATGAEVGTAELREVDGALEVHVAVTGMPPGFHGLHLHAVGLCEPNSQDPADPTNVGDFLTAGGHIGGTSSDHGAHGGDLPSLLVGSDGDGHLTARTDGVTLDEVLDDDGSAVMVHADPDNFAHIPERYAPEGPDEQTRKTGDAGDRVACGVLTG